MNADWPPGLRTYITLTQNVWFCYVIAEKGNLKVPFFHAVIQKFILKQWVARVKSMKEKYSPYINFITLFIE